MFIPATQTSRGGCKRGHGKGVTSHSSHFASRLQEKQLQLEKKYDMEKDKIHNICEPCVA